MTIQNLRPVLLVVFAGLMGIAFQTMLEQNDLSMTLGLSAIFDQLVQRCQDEHPDWSREDCEGVVRGDVWIGMTAEMLVASIGNPDTIASSAADDVEYEQWTYFTAIYGEEVFGLADGILVRLDPVENCTTCGVKTPRDMK